MLHLLLLGKYINSYYHPTQCRASTFLIGSYLCYNPFMQFEVFTVLPEVFSPYLDSSILKRAAERGLIEVHIHNIRDYTHDKHHTTDDSPYGGGGGMVMKPEPIFEAVESVLRGSAQPSQPTVDPVILLSPQGRVFTQRVADELSKNARIALICGRYEGVDERVREHLVTEEISVGDYVL